MYKQKEKSLYRTWKRRSEKQEVVIVTHASFKGEVSGTLSVAISFHGADYNLQLGNSCSIPEKIISTLHFLTYLLYPEVYKSALNCLIFI